jgi:hypothetical protein
MTTDAVVVDDHHLEPGTRVTHEKLGAMRVRTITEARGEVRVRFDVLEVAANQWMAFRLDHIRAAWGDTLEPAAVESTTDQEPRADGGCER